SNNNLVAGNFIGTKADGLSALANGDGVILFNGASNNTIGGTTAAAQNVISGNAFFGVIISGAGTSNNVFAGNLIGTNAAGHAALGNRIGIWIQSGATGNTIGGSLAGSGNVISGNAGDGVETSGTGTSNNVVAGNLIGTNAALANGGNGVAILNGATG